MMPLSFYLWDSACLFLNQGGPALLKNANLIHFHFRQSWRGRAIAVYSERSKYAYEYNYPNAFSIQTKKLGLIQESRCLANGVYKGIRF